MERFPREFLRRSRTLRRWIRSYRLRFRRPDWEALLRREGDRWREALASSRGGPRILIGSAVGGNLPSTVLESLLGVALTMRGAEVHVLLCDGALPACIEASMDWYGEDPGDFLAKGPSQDLCGNCFASANSVYPSLGFTVHRLSDCWGEGDRDRAERLASSLECAEVPAFREEGLAVGEHAYAGALRFFARGDLEREPRAEPVLRAYLKASLLAASAARRLMEKLRFDCLVLQHGIYVPQGLIAEAARGSGTRIVTWNPAYRRGCFVFSHHDTYHHTMMSEPTRHWEDIPWGAGPELDLLAYLESRRIGTNDWIWFHHRPLEDLGAIARELKADFSRPCIGLLTNVAWDAQIHYPCKVFPHMMDWLRQTISYFDRRRDLQLIIRVHPAELRGTLPSRQRAVEEIRRAFPRLPENVFLIPPEGRISTYTVMSHCNAVLVYGTKMGVELSSLDVPVIVAGEAWIRDKGISIDAHSASHYFALLDQLPLRGRMDRAVLERARKYAFHFFFRRMIPLGLVRPTGGWPPYEVALKSLEACLPERDEGLDVICEGILKGSEFIYPAERHLLRG